MQSGELIVTGTHNAQIKLNSQPVRLTVSFSDNGEIFTPCDPGYNDKLDWTISNRILSIRWQVFGIRAVIWSAWFYWSEI